MIKTTKRRYQEDEAESQMEECQKPFNMREQKGKLIFRIEELKKCLSLFNQFHYT